MVNTNEAREKLEHILNKNEYQIYYEDNRSFLEIWWDRAKSWIMEQLSKLFSSFEPSGNLADGILILIIIVIILLVCLFVVLAVRRKRKRKFHEHQPLSAMSEMNWSFQNHLSKASEQEKKQNYSIATRHMFLALLLYFHEKDWLKARIWKTNWEYYAELQKENQQRADQFYHLALLFDEVVYGEKEMPKEEYISYRDEAMIWLNTNADNNTSEGVGGRE